MGCECVLKFLERNNMPVLTKKKHDYLMYDDECIYILKEGVHMTGKWCACSAPSVYL